MVTSLMSIPLSGLRVSALKADAAAGNLANLATDGYRKNRVVVSTAPGGGARAGVEKVDTPGPQVTDPATGQTREMSNVDLLEETAELMAAQRSYEANLASLRAEDRLAGSLLDLLA